MNQIKNFSFSFFILLLVTFMFASCSKRIGSGGGSTLVIVPDSSKSNVNFSCATPAERSDYSIYKLSGDGSGVGDINYIYDSVANQFTLYYLKDVWNDTINTRHPWYAFRTTDFVNYTETSEIIGAAAGTCAQDFAIGAGSVIKKDGKYYAFYTGHNPNAHCNINKEGTMLATSDEPQRRFVKDESFTTIYAPKGIGYDEYDNFRDPFVFEKDGVYYMLLSARKNINGVWRGIICYYTSKDLRQWTFKDVFYDGGADIFFMMETPQLIEIKGTYYLVFSDSESKYVYYRKSSSFPGNWQKPDGYQRFDGKGIFAAKLASDKEGNTFLFGWNYRTLNKTDDGAWEWGGNMIVHAVTQKANGDLAVSLPQTIKNYFSGSAITVKQHSVNGSVTTTGGNNYEVIGSNGISSITFDPLTSNKVLINTTVNFSASAKDFGFMFGACDATENFYSIRFVPSQGLLSLNIEKRSTLTPVATGKTDVPLSLAPGTDYHVSIVIENSVLIVYVNNEVALTCRLYKALGTNWGLFADNSTVTFKNFTIKKPS